MKKKAMRKNKVARLRKQAVLRKPIRKKAAARKRIPARKVAVQAKEISSTARGPESLPEVTDAGRKTTVDVIEVFEVGVSGGEGGILNAEEEDVEPEESGEEVA